MSQWENSTNQGLDGSPIRAQGLQIQQSRNRKVVLVEETLLTTKCQNSSTSQTQKVSLGEADNPHYSSSSNATTISSGTHSTHLLGPSPLTSPRSSVGSLIDTASTISSLVITPSSEQHIFDDLKKQIASSAQRIQHLEKEAKQIPLLQNRIDELQKERGKLANNLQDQYEVTKSLKQRVTMLHEQNSQLGKLLQSHKSGSQEVIAMRNTIMASLAQLKQLQEEVNVLPGLKAQISVLQKENDDFRQEKRSLSKFDDDLPLLEENSRLKAINAKLVEDVNVVNEQLAAVSQSCDGLKHRIEVFENAQLHSTTLRERIKHLVTEKDALNQEIIQLKFHHHISHDIDTAELRKQIVTLHKANCQLRRKMEQVHHDARQQKEQLILKLFEVEASNIKTHKYEIEKQVLEMEQLQVHSPIIRSATASPDHNENPHCSADDPLCSPEAKIQMLKLEQLRIHSTQFRNVMQSVFTERDELERKVAELSTLVDEKGIEDLQVNLKVAETRLDLAVSQNRQLEKELEAVLQCGSDASSAAIELQRLQLKLEKLTTECSSLAESNRRLEEMCEHYKESTYSLDAIKEEKKKNERKYKESKEKLRSLAKELAGSVNLLKDYQSQCSSQQEEIQQMKSENTSLREKYAAAIAELEVARVENQNEDGISAVSAVLSTTSKTGISDGLQEQSLLSQKAEEELQKRNETLTLEVNNLHAALLCNSESLSDAREAKVLLENKLSGCQHLAAENSELLASNAVMMKELASKQEEIFCLTRQIQSTKEQLSNSKALEIKLSDLMQELSSLSTENIYLKDQINNEAKQVSELRQQLSYKDGLQSELITMQQQIRTLNVEIEKLRDQLKLREDQVAQLEKSETKANSRVLELNQKLELLSKQSDELNSRLSTEIAANACKILQLETSKLELKEQVELLEEEKLQVASQYKKAQVAYLELKEHQKDLKDKNFDTAVLSLTKEKEILQRSCLELEKKVSLAEATIKDVQENLQVVRQSLENAEAINISQNMEIENIQIRNQTLSDEVEGYKAMIKSLSRQIDQAELREMEYEVLRQKIRRLEAMLNDSSQLKVDNRTLFSMLQEAVSELPSPFASEGGQSLRDENLRLEQQVSVLSQWNDKQRLEIEMLENRLDELIRDKESLTVELVSKDKNEGMIQQLRQELQETEMEVNALRRQIKPDLQEEMQVKMETQSQIMSMFNEHNQLLQMQVEELQKQVRSLGGRLTREKAVSPPPFPDLSSTTSLTASLDSEHSISEMVRENEMLIQRQAVVESHLIMLRKLSASVRRFSSSVHAVTSIPIAPIHDDVKVR